MNGICVKLYLSFCNISLLLFSFHFFSFSNRVHLEQHTLVTEIRELVFPEDRTRYDELVYSRDPYLSDRERDRHRVSVFVFDKLFACKNMPIFRVR